MFEKAAALAFGRFSGLKRRSYLCIMVKKLWIVALLFLPLGSVWAGINASLGYELFMSGTGERYLESWLLLEGKSLEYVKNEEGKFQATLQVLVLATQNGEIKAYDKYVLESQSYNETEQELGDLFDVHRLPLSQGAYQMEWIIQDLNAPDSSKIQHMDSLWLSQGQGPSLSGIMLIESIQPFSGKNPRLKRGDLELMPRIQSYAFPEEEVLKFYVEAWDTDQFLGVNSGFALRGLVKHADSQQAIPGAAFIKRMNASPSKPFIGQLPISQLTPGYYELEIQILDSTGTQVAQRKKLFYRDGLMPELSEEELSKLVIDGSFVEHVQNIDTLQEMARCLVPISEGRQKQFAQNMAKSKDTLKIKRFLLGFWNQKDPKNPELAWLKHKRLVAAMNQEFGTHAMRGYDTDRGRVYLQYGPPNAVNKRYNEPSAYPYEIWQYYQINAQTNVRFVFYNPNSIDNDFILIHSNCRGEINNRQWQMFVHNRNNSFGVDQNDVMNHYGSWSRDLFDQPR